MVATGEKVRVRGTFADQVRGWFDHLPDPGPSPALKQIRYDKAILDAGGHRHRLRNLRLEECPPPPEKAPAPLRKYYFDIAPEMLPGTDWTGNV